MDKKQKAGAILGLVTLVVAGATVLGKKEEFPENIVLSDLQIIPSEAEVGETVEISCIAYNEGDEQATKKVELEVT